VATQTELEGVAAKKLLELKSPVTGVPISMLMVDAYEVVVGDYMFIWYPMYMLGDTYRVMQLTQGRTTVSMQLDRVRKSVASVAADLSSWEQKGIYVPGSGAWTLNLQGLVGLYRLDEGGGTTAKNNAPIEEPVDGTIVNGSWQQGPIYKMVTFAGDGYVDCGDSLTFSNDAQFSIGTWLSPSELASGTRYLIHKDGQFVLCQYETNGILRFQFTDANNVIHTYDSDPGLLKVGGRHFVVISYDGVNPDDNKKGVYMYMNGHLHKFFPQTGNPHASSNKIYLGVGYHGPLAHCMLWTRRLVDQEVLELYFFPLNRVVQSRGGS
jgi:hypothetical protein